MDQSSDIGSRLTSYQDQYIVTFLFKQLHVFYFSLAEPSLHGRPDGDHLIDITSEIFDYLFDMARWWITVKMHYRDVFFAFGKREIKHPYRSSQCDRQYTSCVWVQCPMVTGFLDHENVTATYARDVDILYDREHPEVEFDGDPKGFLPARVEVIPRGLEVMMPDGG